MTEARKPIDPRVLQLVNEMKANARPIFETFPIKRRESDVDYAVRLFHLGNANERRNPERYDAACGLLSAEFDLEKMREYMKRTGGLTTPSI